jgi:hypothetical protein
MTSRELEDVFKIREAHKRTSELLADGLLEIVTVPSADPFAAPGDRDTVERNGGRVLRITERGRSELARLNAAQTRRDEIARARADRRRQREERAAARARTSS